MIEPKPYYVLTFRSTNDAMKAERVIVNIGSIIPVPSEISAGCGFAVKLPELSPGLELVENCVSVDGLYEIYGRGKDKQVRNLRPQ